MVPDLAQYEPIVQMRYFNLISGVNSKLFSESFQKVGSMRTTQCIAQM